MGVTLYQMVYGTLPFWPPSGNHSELEIMVTHRELSFPSPSSSSPSSVAALEGAGGTGIGVRGGPAGGGVGYGGAGGSGGGLVAAAAAAVVDEQDLKNGKRTLSSGVLTNLEAYDPMVGYLRVSLRLRRSVESSYGGGFRDEGCVVSNIKRQERLQLPCSRLLANEAADKCQAVGCVRSRLRRSVKQLWWVLLNTWLMQGNAG